MEQEAGERKHTWKAFASASTHENRDICYVEELILQIIYGAIFQRGKAFSLHTKPLDSQGSR